MQKFLAILLILFQAFAYGQVEPSTQRFNFGDLYNGSTSYTDITFKNTSDKTQYLLTIDKPRDVYYIYSSKTILPDSSITIRFKINENIKGRFTHNIDIYFSSPRAAIPIQLSGNVKQGTGSTSMTDCPDFDNQKPAYQSTAFDVTIRVIDSLTREPIKNAIVYLVQNGQLINKFVTNSKGLVTEKIPLGYYYITAEKIPYWNNYHEGYLNFNRNYVEIELQQDETVPDPVFEPEVIEEPEEIAEIIEVEDTMTLDEIEEEEIEPVEIVAVDTLPEIQPISVVEPVALLELPDSVFSEDYFKYNNITFILDVSTSMNGMGKMALLKTCINELADILRANDMVSIIKYSSEVDVILKNTMGDESELIKEAVKDLIGTGYTAGGNAIKDAFKLNARSHIKEGNNMVIMITDGAFNRGDKDYLKTIQDAYQSKGTRFSVVGIKTSDFVTTHMKTIVDEGGGDFIRILSQDDAETKLIQEIRRSSFKYEVAEQD